MLGGKATLRGQAGRGRTVRGESTGHRTGNHGTFIKADKHLKNGNRPAKPPPAIVNYSPFREPLF